ncbi:MAG: GNAT family N-acetyltransferase [Ramlibacter sp.]|nr:GNAT family N-acetyltransferase [Ramlibacter sp.]
MPQSVHFRKAQARDADTVAHFNAAMALETEHKVLMPEVIGAGVRQLMATPSMGFYVVAESEERVVASLMITNEWSDWRNGIFWWIQSVYVEPDFRRQGVYRRLYEFVQAMAAADNGVCGFRLYVEKDNTVAQQTYASLGMAQTDYLIYEELKPGIRYFTPNDK